MVPILGSLNHGVSRGRAFELRAAMQNLAESKMNELTNRAVFQGEAIVNSTVTVNYPSDTDVQYHFEVTVEIVSPINMDTEILPGHPLEGSQNQNLKGVSVKVELNNVDDTLSEFPSVDPITLFSILDRPPQLGDKLYAAVPGQNKIYVLEPKTHAQIDVFTLSAEVPLHLAVHPNGEWLAIKTLGKILLMDIRQNSSTRGTFIVVDASYTYCGSTDAGDTSSDSGHTRSDRGLVFRSDGKILYASTHSGGTLIKAFLVPTLPALGTMPSANWVAPAGWSDLSIGSADCMDMDLAENGKIYICEHNTNVKSVDTYTHSTSTAFPAAWQNNTAKLTHHRAAAGSWDGNELAMLYCGGTPNNYLGFIYPRSMTLLQDALMTNTDVAGSDHYMDDLLFARDNLWLFTCGADNGQGKHIYAFARRAGEDWTGSNFSWDVDNANNRSIVLPNADGITTLKSSPYGKEIIADSEGNKVYFVNVKNLADAGSPITYPWEAFPTPGPVSDVAGRIAEQVWIACDGGAGNYSVECLDLYGGDNGKLDEDKTVSLSAAPKHVSLTAGGDKMAVSRGNSYYPLIGDPFDFTSANASINLVTNGEGSTGLEKAVWLLDRSLVVLNRRPGCDGSSGSHEGIYPDNSNLGSLHNGFMVYEADVKGDISGNPKVGFAIRGDGGWRVKDVVAMHRRPGAYVLMHKESVPYDAMLFWIEKSKTGGISGTEGVDEYKIMYQWQTTYDGFPEGRPTRMALSPDDTTLVLYDPFASPNQKLRFYDLNNQRFPQQNGLVMNRYNSNTSFTAAPILTATDLRTEMTKFCARTPSQKVNILNFDENYRTGGHATRFFGYLNSPVSLTGFGIWFEDGGRFYVNGTIFDGGGVWYDSNYATYGSFSTSPSGSVPFQCDILNDGTAWGLIVNYTTGALSAPTGRSGSHPTMSLTGGPSWTLMKASDFRAFRFRPQLLKEVALDGTAPWPTKVTADGDTLVMAFGRDTSYPMLFLGDAKAAVGDVFAIKLFPISAYFSDTTTITGTITDIKVSPDGRRLIVAAKNPDKVFSYDIAYALPYAAPTTISAPTPKALDLPADPISVAVRPFNSFASNPNTYDSWDNVSTAFNADRCGNQTAVVAKDGIYIMGGEDSFTGTALSEMYRYDPLAHSATSLGNFGNSLVVGHSAVISYDNRVFTIAGNDAWPGPLAEEEITAYDVLTSTKFWDTTYDDLRTNANTDHSISYHGGCLTPYGMVVLGGYNGSTYSEEAKVYYPQAYLNTSGLMGETLAMPVMASNGVAYCAAVCHYSKKDKVWYLYRIGGANSTSPSGSTKNNFSVFNFETNAWTHTAVPSALMQRNSLAACSWGDEIFIFGGYNGGVKTEATAWNPDTNKVRALSTFPDAWSNAVAAVPCGPYIYLIDGCNSVTTGSSRKIRRYRP